MCSVRGVVGLHRLGCMGLVVRNGMSWLLKKEKCRVVMEQWQHIYGRKDKIEVVVGTGGSFGWICIRVCRTVVVGVPHARSKNGDTSKR